MDLSDICLFELSRVKLLVFSQLLGKVVVHSLEYGD